MAGKLPPGGIGGDRGFQLSRGSEEQQLQRCSSTDPSCAKVETATGPFRGLPVPTQVYLCFLFTKSEKTIFIKSAMLYRFLFSFAHGESRLQPCCCFTTPSHAAQKFRNSHNVQQETVHPTEM